MSNDNSNGGCGCLSTIIIVVIICLICSYCSREDKSKGFFDNSIEAVHNTWNHIQDVWNGSDSTTVDAVQLDSVNVQK